MRPYVHPYTEEQISDTKMMTTFLAASHYSPTLFLSTNYSRSLTTSFNSLSIRDSFRIRASSDDVESKSTSNTDDATNEGNGSNVSSFAATSSIEKDLKKVVNKTTATFAPRASMASKNPAVPGSALYSIFEIQGYVSMVLGGVLSFNLVFPSNQPDLWRLMGMWSIWMFTIPSLRARDCSTKEKEALNYLFLLIPLLNVIIPFFWKSFSIVWSADVVAFFLMYAWKLGWLQKSE